ncbi:MAG: hypothetical protein ACXIVO_06790 [Glycocaulis sp.]|uniref:hypothetical protein n=1 Tax=Glycocaulis sp. TaxID=1969725 RepID=UPI003F7151E7
MRKPVPLQLVLAMALSPLIAGFLGGTLVSFGLSFQLLPDFTVLETLRTGLVMSFFAVIIAVFVCYTFGVPIMLAGWAAAHFARLRKPHQMGLVMAVAGLIFAIGFFFNGRIFLEDFQAGSDTALLVTLPAGLAAGYVAGWFIGQLGYADTAPGETVRGANA